MVQHLRANLLLLAITIVLCSIAYPLALWAVGQTAFHRRAEGSLVVLDGIVVGSSSIAQPFTADEYFHPRPSAASYNGAASGASNWGANNHLLRNRVSRQLGPIVKFATGSKKGQLAGPDIEAWFQKDQFEGKPAIVAQWATLHPGLAQNWIKADKLNAEYVAHWQKTHSGEVAQWIRARPNTAEPNTADLALPFFTSYSQSHPGTFPSAVERKTADGKTEKVIEPIKEGTDIQAIFFEMWLQAHPGAGLQPVPADMVMASGSGLDPHITLDNALWQLDRVAAAWAKKTSDSPTDVRQEIARMLREKSHAPLGGLVGVPLVNVLEINLALQRSLL